MPLANDIRPKTLEEFLGQKHLVGPDGIVSRMLNKDTLTSMIFWGAPATGKTTLARILAESSGRQFYTLSAVMDGKEALKEVLLKLIPTFKTPKKKPKPVVKRTSFGMEGIFVPKAVQEVIDEAEEEEDDDESINYRELNPVETERNKPGILFIDEIHRWSKTQQDALLPYVESGQIVLVGATTENPSFSVVNALISRTQVMTFNPLSPDDIYQGLLRGYRFLEPGVEPSPGVQLNLKLLSKVAGNDIRYGLNLLETIYRQDPSLSQKHISSAIQRNLNYDKNGDEHYNLISAVHKSLRSSNATAGTYWIVRMLEGGEDALYIARRLLRFASEDIGNANPNALLLANQVFDTCQKLGLPECATALVQLAEYLAKSPKNNSAYVAYSQAKNDVKEYGDLPVPTHLRNAPTQLMKTLGYSKGYEYDHNLESKQSTQECLPEQLRSRDYF